MIDFATEARSEWENAVAEDDADSAFAPFAATPPQMNGVPFGELTEDESTDLHHYEEIIERSLKTFVEVGNALMVIRERRLYRETHDTFESYCKDRWDITHARADQFIRAAEVVGNLETMVSKPNSERVARPLSMLSLDQQREAWQKAVDTAPNGRVTAAHVESIAQSYREPQPSPSSLPWTLDDAIEYLGAKLYEISQRWPQPHLEVMSYQLHSLADELLKNGELRS